METEPVLVVSSLPVTLHYLSYHCYPENAEVHVILILLFHDKSSNSGGLANSNHVGLGINQNSLLGEIISCKPFKVEMILVLPYRKD